MAEWNKANPDIQVTALYNGGSDFALQKTLTAIAGGKPPDITYLFGSWMANIVKSPKVVLLNDLIASDPSFDWEDFWPTERLAATVDGKIVGIPALVDNLAVVYNKKLFDQAGVGYPTAEWTWDDFRAAAKALTDPAKKQFGWSYPADGSEDTVWHWEAMLWEADGDILTPDNTKAAFNSTGRAYRPSRCSATWPPSTSRSTSTSPTPRSRASSTQAASACRSPVPGTCRRSPTSTSASRSCRPS